MRRRDEGFTLIEALLGLAFVSAVTGALAGLLVAALGVTRDAREETGASLLAVEKIEQLRASVRAGLAPPTSPANALDEDVPGFSDQPRAGYQRRWSITLPPIGPPGRILRVRVLLARTAATSGAAGLPARLPGDVVLTTMVSER